MNCKKFEKYLYLWKPGELSENEARQLKSHLDHCPYCRGIRNQLLAQSEFINRMSESSPPTAPDRMKDQIMQVTRQSGEGRVKKMVTPLLLSGRRVSGTAAALLLAIVLIAGAFFILEVKSMIRISRLEQQMRTQARAHSPGNASRRRAFAGGPVSVSAGIRHLTGRYEYLLENADEEQIVVNRGELSQLLNRYLNVTRENRILLNLIIRQFPELEGMSLNDGLTAGEIKALIKKKDSIIQVIDKI